MDFPKKVLVNFVFQFFGVGAQGDSGINTYGVINAGILIAIGYAAGKLL